MPYGRYFLQSDVLDRQQELREEQQQRVQQNRKAQGASAIGRSLLGLAAGALAGPLGPLAMAAATGAGSYAGSQAGAALAGGYRGGEGIDDESGLLRGSAGRLKDDLGELKQNLNTRDLASSAKQGILSYYIGGGSGDFANELRKLRTRVNRGISQSALQEMIEVQPNAYQNYNFGSDEFIGR